MKPNFYLFCKSYRGDLLRAIDLYASILKYNVDQIPFYISVPKADTELFKIELERLNKTSFHLISDEQIVLKGPSDAIGKYHQWDGRKSQQVIKSEFWRLFDRPIDYLCIDSESIFSREFGYADFYDEQGRLFTVMHDNSELLELASRKGKRKVIDNFRAESLRMMFLMDRVGDLYDFGPTPVLWSSEVWQKIEHEYFSLRNISIWEAIDEMPSELRWYGEALLKYKVIPIIPRRPLFLVYHYDWQYFHALKSGLKLTDIPNNYLGYLLQSNWSFHKDFGIHAKRKNIFSRYLRAIKYFIKKHVS